MVYSCFDVSVIMFEIKKKRIKMGKHIILILLLIFSINYAKSQCSTCSSPPACSGGNGAVYNNANINSGDTYWYDSSGDTYSLNFGGGTLIVCGDLTISSMNFNGASTIYITSTGKLTINSNLYLNGGANVYNYGELVVNSGVTLQNSNNKFMNCSSSSKLTITGELTINSSTSYFINNGNADISKITLQGGSSDLMCLGSGSQTNLTNLANNSTNSVTAPSGQACISYSGDAQLNNDLTADADVYVCQQSGATTSGGAGFGNATVFTNCTSCPAVLPVELISFDAKPHNENSVLLSWITRTEINNDYFLILRSKDGVNFEKIAQIKGAGNSNNIINYSYTDNKAYTGLSYYKLQQVDFDGRYTYSKTKTIYLNPFDIINIYPNPAETEISVKIASPEDTEADILIFNTLGEELIKKTTFVKTGYNTIKISTNSLSSGVYIFKVLTPANIHIEKEFVKK